MESELQSMDNLILCALFPIANLTCPQISQFPTWHYCKLQWLQTYNTSFIRDIMISFVNPIKLSMDPTIASTNGEVSGCSRSKCPANVLHTRYQNI